MRSSGISLLQYDQNIDFVLEIHMQVKASNDNIELRETLQHIIIELEFHLSLAKESGLDALATRLHQALTCARIMLSQEDSD